MDSVTLIVGALGGAIASGMADAAASDAYGRLKRRVRAQFAGHREAEATLERFAADPDRWQAALVEAVVATGAGADESVVAAAEDLIALVEPIRAPIQPAPIQIGRPPVPPRAFQHRESLSSEITSDRPGRDSTARRTVLAGSGGVGKTQLAADAFARARDAGVEVLVWVNASTRESILATYAQAGAEIDDRQRVAANADQAAERFLVRLVGATRRWLVVLDDIADPVDVRGLWPEGPWGWVLATTRRRDLLPAGARQVSVGAFTPTQARRYLAERLTGTVAHPAHPDVLDEAEQLADDVGCLPVALAQAAAGILNEGVTCADYRRRFADRSETLERLFPADPAADDGAPTVAATWSLAIERADQLAPEGLARPALRIAAVLDPDGAPEELWTTGSALAFLGTPGRTTAREARTALRNLHRLSLVAHDVTGGPQAVRTHALVQRATLEQLPTTGRYELARLAADALAESWPSTEKDPELARVLRNNVAAVADRVPDALWDPEPHEVFLRAGRSLGELGLVRDAVVYWSQLAATASRLLGPSSPTTLTCRRHRARWTGETGDVAEARRLMSGLLDECRDVLGPDHPDTLATRHRLADWRGAAGRPADARRAFEALVTDRIRLLGPDHPDTLATRHGLTYWVGEAGDPARAARGLQKLLDDRIRMLGPDHPDTLATRHGLTRWQGAMGDAVGAADALSQLLEDRIRVLGPDHPHTLATRHDMADWRGEAGDARAAAEALEGVLGDQLRVLGPDHPHTLATRNHLADWRGETGDAAGAVRAFEELLEDQMRVLGPDHPDTLCTRHGLADWRGVAGDPTAAADAFEHLLADQLRVVGPDHPATLATRHGLARWRGAAGDAAGAAAAMAALLADRRRVLGAEHPDTLATLSQLADWKGAAGDPAGAVADLEEALADHLRILGPDHLATLATSDGLAGWRAVAGDGDGDGAPAALPVRRGLSDWRAGRVRRWATRWSSRVYR